MEATSGGKVGDTNHHIFDATTNCFQRFENYIASNGRNNVAHAENLCQRLEIWAKYSGARARKGLSLDDRLKEHGDIQAAVLGLLDVVLQNLDQGRFSQIRDSVTNIMLVVSAPDKDVKHEELAMATKMNEEEESEELAIKSRWRNYNGTAWEAVDAAIDMLLDLAKVIRKSTASKRDFRLPSHFVRPDDTYFEEITKLLVRSRFPHARRTLADQIGIAIFTRRRRLLYQQRHEDKLAHPRSGPAQLEITPNLKTSIPDHKDLRLRDQTHQKPSTPPLIHPAVLAPSETELSKIDKSVLNRRRKAPTTVSGRTSGSVSREEGQPDYPNLPPFERKNKDCICPYCSEPLSTAKMNTAYWR